MVRAGVELTVHPMGVPRPNDQQMKHILETYDCVIIGTSQRIKPEMFENVHSGRVIATASVGLDHIMVPSSHSGGVVVLNTPKANAQSVAEYTIGCALSCIKRLREGNRLYYQGQNNKSLHHKPEDISGKTMGVIGAGTISSRIMEYAVMLGMRVICWTAHPEKHRELLEQGVCFVALEELVEQSDVISVNLPNTPGTRGLISSDLIQKMRKQAVFISVSRLQTVDYISLFQKAERNPGFYVCLDVDVDSDVVKNMPQTDNVVVTPHIAGGTVETRKRMFLEIAERVAAYAECEKGEYNDKGKEWEN